MRRFLTTLVLLSALLAIAGCLHDYSGISGINPREYIITNNRPGLFERCRLESADKLSCRHLAFKSSEFGFYDFEGLAWINDHLFYAVIEKRNNRCLAGCSLEQKIIPLRIEDDTYVTQAACGEMEIPLLKGDDPDCEFANCGLEGVAYNPRLNLLYVVKEHSQKRIFTVPLDGKHCPAGNYGQIQVGDGLANYSDIAYSQARNSIFLLSRVSRDFVEYSLDAGKIVLHARDVPGMAEFFSANDDAEGIFVLDDTSQIIVMGESRAFVLADLPEAGRF